MSSLVSRKVYKYICNCLMCNGKEVVARTQEKHANDKDLWKSKSLRKNQLARIKARKYSKFMLTHLLLCIIMHKIIKSGTRYINFIICVTFITSLRER